MADKLREAGSVVRSFRAALAEGEGGLKAIPGLLLRIIKDELWRDRLDLSSGQRVHFNRFVDFVTTPPIEGLGEDPETLLDLCKKHDAAYKALVGALKGDHGGDRKSAEYEIKSDNITLDIGRGTSRAYGLTWLDENRPDLYEAVLRKEMSVNRAMIQAGQRKKSLSIPLEPESAARRLAKAFDIEGLRRLVAELETYL